MPELFINKLLRVGPHAVGVGEVGTPHDVFHAQIVEQLDADPVRLVGGLALPVPVLAGFHGQCEVFELVFPLEVHMIDEIRDPADAAFTDYDLYLRAPLQNAGVDN